MTLEEQQNQLDQLLRATEELQQQITGLQQAEQRRREPSMRKEVRCPSCGGRRLIHATKVLDRDGGSRTEMSLVQPSVWSAKGVGKIEAFICAGCGLMEWWVKEVDEVLDRMAKGKIDELELINAETGGEPAGPYR